MALIYDQSPSTLSLSKNPIVYVLSSNNYITTTGVNAETVFFINPSAGDTLTIAFGDEELVFTFVSGTPDSSGQQLRIKSSETHEAYLTNKLIPGLKANNTLYSNFYINKGVSPNEDYVILVAKNTGAEFTLTITSDSGTLDLLTSTAGVDEVARENFKVVCDLIVYNNIGEEVLISLEQVPDKKYKQVSFDFSPFLETLLSFTPPSVGYGLIFQDSLIINKYTIRAYESYGDPSTDYAAIMPTTDTYVISGGMKKQSWQPYNNLILELEETDPKRFLTWHPLEKEIGINDTEYLYFLNTKNISNIYLKVRITYSDDSTNEITPLDSYANKYAVYWITTGYSQLGLASYEEEDKEIIKYEVWLEDEDSEVLSETRTYIVDRTNYQQLRQFFYTTSLGGFDSISAIGEAEMSTKINYESSVKILDPLNYGPHTGEKLKLNISYQDEYQVAAGLYHKNKIQALQDILISENTYELVNGIFISIEILNKEQIVFNESDDLHSLVLQYKHNYINKALSL